MPKKNKPIQPRLEIRPIDFTHDEAARLGQLGFRVEDDGLRKIRDVTEGELREVAKIVVDVAFRRRV